MTASGTYFVIPESPTRELCAVIPTTPVSRATVGQQFRDLTGKWATVTEMNTNAGYVRDSVNNLPFSLEEETLNHFGGSLPKIPEM